jgi:hypothetical protein
MKMMRLMMMTTMIKMKPIKNLKVTIQNVKGRSTRRKSINRK